MDAHSKTIDEIIQGRTLLRIPYFQRRYVWEDKDWERFAIDMESLMDSDRNYFLGAIILKEEEISLEDKRKGIAVKQVVIDGQQRLTTLSIYMKVLHMLAGENGDFVKNYLQKTSQQEPVIIHNCDDRPIFHRIMNLESAKKIETPRSNIDRCYNFFLDSLRKTHDRGISLNELLNMINACIRFVVISLKQEDDEQQIFDTINSLGVPLTTDELLKNFLYEANDEDAYKRNWRDVFDTDQARKFWGTDAASTSMAKTKESRMVERFFYAFVRLKMWDFELTDFQKKNYVKTENVFVTCKAFVEKHAMSKQDLANEIITYAKLYRDNFDPAILKKRIPQYFGIERLACYIMATTGFTIVPYVLYILNKVVDRQERKNIFGYLECYLIRRKLCFPSSYDKDYTGQFAEYLIGGQHCITYQSLKDYLEGKDSTQKLRMPSNDEVINGIDDKTLDETNARLIYYLYESKLVPVSDQTFTDGYNDYSAIQLMPKYKEGDENWPRLEDDKAEKERTKRIGSLSNYFMLDCTADTKELKKTMYKDLNTKLSEFKKYAEDIRSSRRMNAIRTWTMKDIESQNKLFAEKFCNDIWNL